MMQLLFVNSWVILEEKQGMMLFLVQELELYYLAMFSVEGMSLTYFHAGMIILEQITVDIGMMQE